MTPYININVDRLARDLKYNFGLYSKYTYIDIARDIFEILDWNEFNYVSFLYKLDDVQDCGIQLFKLREFEEFIDVIEYAISRFSDHNFNETQKILDLLVHNSVLTVTERNHGDIITSEEE